MLKYSCRTKKKGRVAWGFQVGIKGGQTSPRKGEDIRLLSGTKLATQRS